MLHNWILMSIKGFWYIENDNNLKRLERIYWDQRSFLVWQMETSFHWYPGWGARTKVDMSRPSQTEIVNVQSLPYGKSLCPDFRAFKNFCALIVPSNVLMSRLLCVQNSNVQTFVRSKGRFVYSKTDYLCVHVQPIVRSKDLMSRLSCVLKKVRALRNW